MEITRQELRQSPARVYQLAEREMQTEAPEIFALGRYDERYKAEQIRRALAITRRACEIE